MPAVGYAYTNSELADYLYTLDVPFVWGDAQQRSAVSVEHTDLVVRLAANEEARLRLALIPLFLRHPSFAQHAKTAVMQLTESPLLVLRCYYTAAYFLQQIHHTRLCNLFGPFTLLPDLFSVELGLSSTDTPVAGLQSLAASHRLLSGQAINWLGTYQHGAEQFLRYCEKRQRWQQSPLTVFVPS